MLPQSLTVELASNACNMYSRTLDGDSLHIELTMYKDHNKVSLWKGRMSTSQVSELDELRKTLGLPELRLICFIN